MNITVEMLLENSKKIERKETVKVKIEELNGAILELEVLNRMEILDILSSNSTDKDSELIYTSGKIFKDEKLITQLGCQMNPIEVVPKVLSQSTIVNISELLITKAGRNEKYNGEEGVEEIQN